MLKIMKHISDLGHNFCIRAKDNSNSRFLMYDKLEKHEIYKRFTDLPIQKHHALYYKDIPFGSFQFKCNLSIAQGKLSDDPWFILSNIEPNKALREYAHRFGAIECLFKNQKSNGFYLESTVNATQKYFESMYTIACFSTLFLVIFEDDYTKNSKCYKNIKLTTHKKFKNGIIV